MKPINVGTAAHDTLESLVNSHGVEGIIEALAKLCEENAASIREAEEDKYLADLWSDDAKELQRALSAIKNSKGSAPQ